MPGGVGKPARRGARPHLAAVPEGIAIAERRLAWFAEHPGRFAEGSPPSPASPAFAALVGPAGDAEYYNGTLRFVGPDGATLARPGRSRPLPRADR
ncbi:MAG: hypothetical protein U0232_02980 [Thermomicrobiales bacterium]